MFVKYLRLVSTFKDIANRYQIFGDGTKWGPTFCGGYRDQMRTLALKKRLLHLLDFDSLKEDLLRILDIQVLLDLPVVVLQHLQLV